MYLDLSGLLWTQLDFLDLLDSDRESESNTLIFLNFRPYSDIQMKSTMGHRDKMIARGDLEDHSNMLSHSWSAERNTYIYICDK